MNNNREIIVSICCVTYNHEKYIEKALDSLLNQNTNFNYEIIIKDDASTDNTVNIIKKYEKKYPNIIRTIYEKENQYSKTHQLMTKMYPMCKGKYVAVCEGDDYWIDSNKLQKQVDYLDNHPECSLLWTNYKILNDYTNKIKKVKRKSKHYSIEEIIMNGGDFFATASVLVPSKHLKKFEKFYYVGLSEDYNMVLHLALCGKVFLMKDYTTMYRINSLNSITQDEKTGNVIEKHWKMYNSIKDMFKEFNKETKNKYKKYTDYVLLKREFIIYVIDNDKEKIKDKKFKSLYKIGSLKSRFIYFNKIHFYKLYRSIRNYKHKIEKY